MAGLDINSAHREPAKMPPLIVSLDQKDWIGLARGYYGVDPNHADIARIIVQVTQSGTAVLPLSVTHLDEIAGRCRESRSIATFHEARARTARKGKDARGSQSSHR